MAAQVAGNPFVKSVCSVDPAVRADQVAITNPIHFEGPDYKPPQPAQAKVRAVVTDASTGKPFDGDYEVMQMIGRRPVATSRAAFNTGRFTLVGPATARTRVASPGYAPVVRSIFVETPALLDKMLNMRVEQLLDWQTFEEIRRL